MLNISFKSNNNVRAFSTHKIAPQRVAISFGYDSPIKDLAKHCAYCGCETMTTKEIEVLVNKLLETKGPELYKLLSNISYQETNSISSKPQRNILSILTNASKLHPEKTGRELANNIINTTNNSYQKRINSIKNNTLIKNALTRLEELSPSLHSDLKKIVVRLIKDPPPDYVDLLPRIITIKAVANKKHHSLPPDFLAFVEDIENQAKEIKNRKKDNKFLLNCYKYTPEELLTQLVQPLKITMEHLKVRCQGGKDSTYNFLPVCSGCNADRGHKNFKDFMRERPNIESFIARSIFEVKKAIENLPDPSEGLKTYVQKIVETLFSISKGEIKINL